MEYIPLVKFRGYRKGKYFTEVMKTYLFLIPTNVKLLKNIRKIAPYSRKSKPNILNFANDAALCITFFSCMYNMHIITKILALVLKQDRRFCVWATQIGMKSLTE